MKWWWAGVYGALMQKKRSERASGSPLRAPARDSVALVVGSTSLAGAALLDILPLEDTPGGPWTVHAISRRPLPAWYAAAQPPSVTHVHLDLADADAVAEALTPLTDITHVFYFAWASSPPPAPSATDIDKEQAEVEERAANCAMLRNVLSVVVPNCPVLAHICIQTSRRHFVDPFEPLSSMPIKLRPFSEDLPRLTYPDLEDTLLDGLNERKGSPVTWSVHRPATIFGFSPRSARNIVASLCVYAAICHEERVKLRWPGSRVVWEGFSDASDAELVAEQALWSALEPNGKNEAFHCTNGDVYTWKLLWPMLAFHFNLEWTGYEGQDQRFKLEEAMAGKEEVWAEIVKEHDLLEADLEEITNWRFVDAVLSEEKAHLDTMNKSKEYGFLGFRNTVRCFNAWVAKLKSSSIVPNLV
ncbi:3-oxo-Delta(4,5)-steroid 5-beta-reductase-like [Oryza brachyantha]|uniref:3-oxo-Delta(4,5)-steroid 5-beta-reductase-like n=1 Tax=Oryza brachyantha TaxID=4533 RepID=UPI001ADD3BCB|nr:3-oxo-Delta(4,5)-steroid 5-beta-reductase-like [Oryza brachyantha]